VRHRASDRRLVRLTVISHYRAVRASTRLGPPGWRADTSTSRTKPATTRSRPERTKNNSRPSLADAPAAGSDSGGTGQRTPQRGRHARRNVSRYQSLPSEDHSGSRSHLCVRRSSTTSAALLAGGSPLRSSASSVDHSSISPSSPRQPLKSVPIGDRSRGFAGRERVGGGVVNGIDASRLILRSGPATRGTRPGGLITREWTVLADVFGEDACYLPAPARAAAP
jgi:hypothetical protein